MTDIKDLSTLLSSERRDSNTVCYEQVSHSDSENKIIKSMVDTHTDSENKIIKHTLDDHKLVGWIQDPSKCPDIIKSLTSKYPDKTFVCTDFNKLHYLIQDGLYGIKLNQKPKQAANKIFTSTHKSK